MIMASTSQISFLKQVVAIMMGLSLTSTVQTFIKKYLSEGSIDNQNIWQHYLIFLLILLNIIRFFFDKWMYLETELTSSNGFPGKSSPANNSKKILVSFIIIIVQSLIFSVLSLKTYDRFFYFFSVVLVVDAVGFTLLASLEKNKSFSLERSWILNNALSVIALLSVFLIIKNHNFYWCFAISALNTLVGFVLSWRRFYFSQ